MISFKPDNLIVEVVCEQTLTIKLNMEILGLKISKCLAKNLNLEDVECCREILKSKNIALSRLHTEKFKDISEFKIKNCPNIELDIIDNTVPISPSENGFIVASNPLQSNQVWEDTGKAIWRRIDNE